MLIEWNWKQFRVPLFPIGDTAITGKKGCTIESINNAIKACQQSSYGGNITSLVSAICPRKCFFCGGYATTKNSFPRADGRYSEGQLILGGYISPYSLCWHALLPQDLGNFSKYVQNCYKGYCQK